MKLARGMKVGRMAGVIALCLGAAACGSPPAETTAASGDLELTWVGIEQFSTPNLITDPTQVGYLVTVRMTMVFRLADHPWRVRIDFDGRSGEHTTNELDLAALDPDLPEASDGRWRVLAPVKIPELGALQYSVVLTDQAGRTSRPIVGSFTVLDSFGGSSGGQLTEGNTVTVSGGP